MYDPPTDGQPLCKFPFTYLGHTYYRCFYHDEFIGTSKSTNFRSIPFCALEADIVVDFAVNPEKVASCVIRGKFLYCYLIGLLNDHILYELAKSGRGKKESTAHQDDIITTNDYHIGLDSVSRLIKCIKPG